MSKKKFNLLIIAHPDDETIFFSGLLQSLRKLPWTVICATDGNADGNGAARRAQFGKAMKLHRVQRFEMWDFPDMYNQRLDVPALASRLSDVGAFAQSIFTHGVLGEYGHPHHQDVCMAVHLAFPKKKIMSVAYNCRPDLIIRLTEKQFALKAKVFSQIYFSETHRFAQFLPATAVEGFAGFKSKEVESLYRWLTTGQKPDSIASKKYRWFFPYLEEWVKKPMPRPF